MMTNLVKRFGTIMPVAVLIGMVIGFLTTIDGVLGWERPALYEITALTALMGLWALTQMARDPHSEFPSVFILTLIYQKALLFIFWQLIAILIMAQEPQDVENIGDIFAYGLLIGTTVCMGSVNFVLFFGRTRGWLALQADPVPFRQEVRRLRGIDDG